MNQSELSPRKKQPTEFYEFEGVIRAVTYEGSTRKGEPFVRLKAKSNTGEIYKMSKFNSSAEDVESLVGRPVRFDYYCSQDSIGTEYKNIDGDIEVLNTSNAQQPVHTTQQPPQGHFQPLQGHYAHEHPQQYQSAPQHYQGAYNGSQPPQQYYQEQQVNNQQQNQPPVQQSPRFDDFYDDVPDL